MTAPAPAEVVKVYTATPTGFEPTATPLPPTAAFVPVTATAEATAPAAPDVLRPEELESLNCAGMDWQNCWQRFADYISVRVDRGGTVHSAVLQRDGNSTMVLNTSGDEIRYREDVVKNSIYRGLVRVYWNWPDGQPFQDITLFETSSGIQPAIMVDVWWDKRDGGKVVAATNYINFGTGTVTGRPGERWTGSHINADVAAIRLKNYFGKDVEAIFLPDSYEWNETTKFILGLIVVKC